MTYMHFPLTMRAQSSDELQRLDYMARLQASGQKH